MAMYHTLDNITLDVFQIDNNGKFIANGRTEIGNIVELSGNIVRTEDARISYNNLLLLSRKLCDAVKQLMVDDKFGVDLVISDSLGVAYVELSAFLDRV